MATAQFAYRIKASTGKVEKGTVEADNYSDALAKVRKLGGFVMSLEETKASKKVTKSNGKKGLGLKDKIIFTEQLAVMLNAGITLLQALKGLQEETSSKALAAILVEVIADVEGGLPLSDAFTKHPRAFSTIYCEMVRSAEKTGNLAEVLNQLTTQQQKEYELKSKVKGALIYPAIVTTLLIAVITMVITFILPKLNGLFQESNIALPLSTRILLGISYFMTHQWYLLLILLVALVVGFRVMVHTRAGRLFWDRIKMRIPVLGSFMRKAYMARFTQSFASLAQAGIPVLEVFKTVRGVIGNAAYEVEIDKITQDVSNGVKVSVAIRKSKYFPPMIGQLVSVGEQSGDLAGIFKVLSEFFDKEVDTMAKNLSTLLEPIIMIVMGVVIGFVLVSVLQPIYGLVNAV